MEDSDVVQALAALAEPLGVPASTFSFYLKELVHAGLVSCERSGRNLIYRADFFADAGPAGSPDVASWRRRHLRRRPASLLSIRGGNSMKRFHVHTHVADLQKSIAFSSTMFAADQLAWRAITRSG